jgi:hypothetical protein
MKRRCIREEVTPIERQQEALKDTLQSLLPLIYDLNNIVVEYLLANDEYTTDTLVRKLDASDGIPRTLIFFARTLHSFAYVKLWANYGQSIQKNGKIRGITAFQLCKRIPKDEKKDEWRKKVDLMITENQTRICFLGKRVYQVHQTRKSISTKEWIAQLTLEPSLSSDQSGPQNIDVKAPTRKYKMEFIGLADTDKGEILAFWLTNRRLNVYLVKRF